jgi:hypothetical protein
MDDFTKPRILRNRDMKKFEEGQILITSDILLPLQEKWT